MALPVDDSQQDKPQGGLSELSNTQAAYQKYIQAMNTLNAALERRAADDRSQLYWKMAQGFLAPTKSGSTGESISNVAGAVSDYAEKQKESDLAIARMRAELAGKNFEMAGVQDAYGYLGRLTAPQPAGNVVTTQGNVPQIPTAPIAKAGAAGPEWATKEDVRVQPVNQQGQIISGQPTSGQAAGFNQAYMPDAATLNMLIAANPGKPQAVIGEIAKRRLEFDKPSDLQRDLYMLENPNVSPIVKMGIVSKHFGDSFKPYAVKGPEGTVQTTGIAETAKFLRDQLGLGGQQTTPTTGINVRPSAGAPTGVSTSQRQPAARSTTVSGGEPTTVGVTTTTPEGFSVPVPPPPAKRDIPTGFTKGSEEDLKLREKFYEKNVDFMTREKGPLDTARLKYDAANANFQQYTDIIDSARNFEGGITAAPIQFFDRLVDAFGFSSPDQYKRMISTGVIDKAGKQIIANDLKATFGGNPTEGERKYLDAALINITDPKELVLFTAMMKRAAAVKDIAKYEYLDAYKNLGNDAVIAFDRWARKQNPTVFEPGLLKLEKNIFPARKREGATTPAGAKTEVRRGTVTDGPNKGKTAIEYSDGTIGYQ